MDILIATKNNGKLNEFKAILTEFGYNLISLQEYEEKHHQKIDDVEEYGQTLMENALIKAFYYYQMTNMPVICDDTGLFINYLNDEPGIYTARYSGLGDKGNRDKVLNKLKNVENRSAHFETNLVFYDGKMIITSTGRMDGSISLREKGTRGFGYDSIFYVDEYQKTLAEITLEEKNTISHRFKALKSLVFKLNLYYNLIDSKEYIKDLFKELYKEEVKSIEIFNQGMSNDTYLVESNSYKKMFRIPGYSSEIFIDRHHELLGLNRVKGLEHFIQFDYFDEITGIKVSSYIQRENTDQTDLLVTLKELHKLPKLGFSYDAFKRLRYYERLNKIINTTFSNDYYQCLEALNKEKDYLFTKELCFCHNDCQLSNFIGKHLIDFEFVGDNDKLFDYACFGNNDINIAYQFVDMDEDIEDKNDAKHLINLYYIIQSLSWYQVALFKHYTGFSEASGLNFLEIAVMFLNKAKELSNL